MDTNNNDEGIEYVQKKVNKQIYFNCAIRIERLGVFGFD